MTLQETRLPARLVRLYEASRGWGYFAGDFEFELDGPASATAWFADREEPAREFAVFGRVGGGAARPGLRLGLEPTSGTDGRGGLFALWLYPGRSPEDAPVVLLDSECLDNGILASDADAFLSLLATDVGGLSPVTDPSAPPADSPDRARYLAWLAGEGIAPASRPEEVIAGASAGHPDLEARIDAALAD